jgi:hypothetical protein
MHPKIGRDLARLGQLDHVHRRRVAAFLARPAFQRRLKFPDWRIPRPADVGERQAGARLTALALDLEPAQPAVEALRDRRRPRANEPERCLKGKIPKGNPSAVRVQ